MKKLMIVLMFVTLFILSTVAVAAVVRTDPYSSVRARRWAPSLSSSGCNLDIVASPEDIRYMGNARRECINKNRHNYICQRKCFDKVKLRSRGTNFGSTFVRYSKRVCKDIDTSTLVKVLHSRCYYTASVECAKVNEGNTYCRRRCLQNAYKTCRKSNYRRGLSNRYSVRQRTVPGPSGRSANDIFRITSTSPFR